MSEKAESLARHLLTELVAKLNAEGLGTVDALGLSVFAIRDGNVAETMQVSAFGGDLAALGMFGPEWPFALTADLLEEPTDTIEAEQGRSVN